MLNQLWQIFRLFVAGIRLLRKCNLYVSLLLVLERQHGTPDCLSFHKEACMKLVALSFVIVAGPAIAASETADASSYRSIFADYRAFNDEPIAAWADVNAEMERLGGHSGHVAAPPVPTPKHDSRPPENPGQPAPNAEH